MLAAQTRIFLSRLPPVCRGPGFLRAGHRAPFNTSAPRGGGGVPHHRRPWTHPPLKEWAKFSSGPSADQNFSLSQGSFGGGGVQGGWVGEWLQWVSPPSPPRASLVHKGLTRGRCQLPPVPPVRRASGSDPRSFSPGSQGPRLGTCVPGGSAAAPLRCPQAADQQHPQHGEQGLERAPIGTPQRGGRRATGQVLWTAVRGAAGGAGRIREPLPQGCIRTVVHRRRGGGPPPLLPFQCLRLTAKILLRRLRCQED